MATTNPTPGQLRTAAATAAKKRARLDRLAPEFRAAGWTVHPPEEPCPGLMVVREAIYAGPCQENGIGQCVTPGHQHP